jgi:penicillin-binding protein 2
VVVTASLSLALFAVVFLRLWFLQVLSGGEYLRAATVNRVREVSIAPPRGEILDRRGVVLAGSRPTRAVEVSPARLPVPVSTANIARPPHKDAALYAALARVLTIQRRRHRCPVAGASPRLRLSPVACAVAQQVALRPYADVVIRIGVSRVVQYFLAERRWRYPGVSVVDTYVTAYPDGDLAAQALGTVGPVTAAELRRRDDKGLAADAIVGQSGLEAAYDAFLRGTSGVQRVQVDATGQPAGTLAATPPTPGDDLVTSLDARLQRAGEQALARSITTNGGTGGAFVALDPRSGAVLALGSNPSFRPAQFAGGISRAAYERLTAPAAGDPLLNRAIASVAPSGSTFKPVAATAALESGAWSLDQVFDDTGRYCVGSGLAQQCRHNSGRAVYGPVDLSSALRVSSDDFFYNLGVLTNAAPATHPHGGALQRWARAYGVGRRTGIDLPDAASGTLPDAEWRAHRNRLEAQCDAGTGPFRSKPHHRAGGCGIADGTNRPWSVGDNESLALGQGDVQTSPLQLAVVYAALANGGSIVRPHLATSVRAADGTVLQRIDALPLRHLRIDPAYLSAIRAGLLGATSQPGGTSADVFAGFGEPVYGKTGTAQYFDADGTETDDGWYACFVPSAVTHRPIVVVVWVQKGGFGDISAAPVARQILSQWFDGRPGPYVSGRSTSL